MMSDPVAKAKALQEKALIRSQEAREQAKRDRAILWHRIQTEAPEIANLLTVISEKMGKPSKFKIEFFKKFQKVSIRQL